MNERSNLAGWAALLTFAVLVLLMYANVRGG